jgi:hypothetical protein
MSNITQNGGTIYIQQSGNNIQYQSNGTSGVWSSVTSFPVTFVNSNPVSGNILTISLFSNITIGILAGYFITGSEYITYDGTGKTITISNVTNYLGLIRNGTSSSNGYSNVTLQNINSSISGNSTLEINGGYICQSYFGRGVNNIVVNNCSNSGAVNNDDAGGIIGGETVNNGGKIIITNCSNSGFITSNNAGGICGRGIASFNGNVSITDCSNTGNINGNDAGGICGYVAGFSDGIISITNCSNTGIINGAGAGGITGGAFGITNNNLCSVINCYNTGNINGSNAGGICGTNIGLNYDGRLPKILIQNCYSLGNIATTCGGICGGGTTGYNIIPIINIINCYTSYDSIAQPGTGGNTGSQYISLDLSTNVRNAITLTNVYSSLINSWSNTDANNALTGIPQRFFLNSKEYIYYTNYGLTWYSSKTNAPYFLISFLNKIPRRVKRSFVNSLR